MISVAEAFRIIDESVRPGTAESVPLSATVGRVLSGRIVSDLDLPPFDRSQMDGFAVRSADTAAAPARMRIVGESVAGRGYDGTVGPGEAVRTMTGARVASGADAVQKVELTTESDGEVVILEPVSPEQNIVRRGAEIRRGAVVFEPGETISAEMVAALASFGCDEVPVCRRPKIRVMATGTEIVPIGTRPGRDQIRNSNSAMLRALAARLGYDAELLEPVGDDEEAIKRAIERAAAPGDVLIVTGGVSVGDYDFTKPALRDLGADILFEKIALKPGKPTVFARFGEALVFGLPGNPVSVAVTFHLFVRRALAAAQGAKTVGLRAGFAVCGDRVKGAKTRDCYLPVALGYGNDGRLSISSLRFSGSSNFIEFARSEALVYVPQGQKLSAGDVAEVYFY